MGHQIFRWEKAPTWYLHQEHTSVVPRKCTLHWVFFRGKIQRMVHPIVLFFVIFSGLFAAVHKFAVKASLYWYYWWFDILMHFWGGILIGLGVHTFCSFRRIHIRPSLWLVLIALCVSTVTWEIFELYAGLFDPATHLFDTSKDIVVGFSGGLLAHIIMRNYTIG